MFLKELRNPLQQLFVFVGYNVPQLSKLRERRTLNLSADQLRDFALTISSMLLENYWERTYWRQTLHIYLIIHLLVFTSIFQIKCLYLLVLNSEILSILENLIYVLLEKKLMSIMHVSRKIQLGHKYTSYFKCPHTSCNHSTINQ